MRCVKGPTVYLCVCLQALVCVRVSHKFTSGTPCTLLTALCVLKDCVQQKTLTHKYTRRHTPLNGWWTTQGDLCGVKEAMLLFPRDHLHFLAQSIALIIKGHTHPCIHLVTHTLAETHTHIKQIVQLLHFGAVGLTLCQRWGKLLVTIIKDTHTHTHTHTLSHTLTALQA